MPNIAHRGAPHSARRALVVNAAELLREPGLRRRVAASVVLDALDLQDHDVDRQRLQGPVTVHVELTSTLDVVLAEATIGVGFVSECSRCLAPIDEQLVIEASERFADAAGAGARAAAGAASEDVFAIEHGQLDLAPFVREAVLLDLPDAPRCRADCAGLCPVCGIDRNVTTCDCAMEAVDDRWSALDALRQQ